MMTGEGLTVRDILLAHRFSMHPGEVSDHSQGRRSHGIVFGISGEMEYEIKGGNSFRISAGDALYVPFGIPYRAKVVSDVPFTHITVNFSLCGDGEEKSGERENEKRVFVNITKRQFSSPARFLQTASALVRTWTFRHPFYRERCLGLLYEMIYIFRSEVLSAPNAYFEKISPARDYIDGHFTEDFQLSVLPEMCGMSETYFRRIFRKVCGESPAEYRRRLRISRAEDLLKDGQFDVSEVAYLTGYDDPAYFSRAFRKTAGTSPSAFRSEYADRTEKKINDEKRKSKRSE